MKLTLRQQDILAAALFLFVILGSYYLLSRVNWGDECEGSSVITCVGIVGGSTLISLGFGLRNRIKYGKWE
jgi:hypothetical protein